MNAPAESDAYRDSRSPAAIRVAGLRSCYKSANTWSTYFFSLLALLWPVQCFSACGDLAAGFVVFDGITSCWRHGICPDSRGLSLMTCVLSAQPKYSNKDQKSPAGFLQRGGCRGRLRQVDWRQCTSKAKPKLHFKFLFWGFLPLHFPAARVTSFTNHFARDDTHQVTTIIFRQQLN